MYKKIIDELYYEIKNEYNNIDKNNYENEYYSIKNSSQIHKYYTDKLKAITQLPQIPYNKCNFVLNGECKKEFNILNWKHKCIMCKKNFCSTHIININTNITSKINKEKKILIYKKKKNKIVKEKIKKLKKVKWCKRCYIAHIYINDIYDGGVATFKLKTLIDILYRNTNAVNPIHYVDIIPPEFNYIWFKKSNIDYTFTRIPTINDNNRIYKIKKNMKPFYFFNTSMINKNRLAHIYNNLCLTEHLMIENAKDTDYIRLTKRQIKKIVDIYNSMIKLNDKNIRNLKYVKYQISYDWILSKQVIHIIPPTLFTFTETKTENKIKPKTKSNPKL